MEDKIELKELLKKGYVQIKEDGSYLILEKADEKILYSPEEQKIVESSLDRKVFFSPG